MGFWDNFGAGEHFKFVTPGDTIEGVVLRLSVTNFGGSNDSAPVLLLRTAQGDKEVTASQTVLIRRLAEAAPEVGDRVQIRYDGEAAQSLPGKSPAKLFTVRVQRKDGQPAAPPHPAVPESWAAGEEPF